MKNRLKLLPLIIIITLLLQLLLPVVSSAADLEASEEGTLKVTAKRDEINPNQVNITATDTQYNIVDLKYVHKRIEKSEISYFEEDNEDVYIIEIAPSQNVKASFMLEGYGTYTIYARNSHGDRYLFRITVRDPGEVPDLTLIKNDDNPLSLTIQAISENSNIAIIKIAKLEDINQDIDFNTEGTNIEFNKSSNVNLIYTVNEEGLYEVYAEDENGANVTKQIYLSENKTPIEVNIVNLGNRQVRLDITDNICNITKIKVAKASEISDFEDFDTKGEDLSFTQSKTVNVNYTAPEDATYTFFIEDEAGYRKMVDKRIVSEGTSMKIEIIQENENPGNITIRATGATSDIVELKVAMGENINIDYFKDNGESLEINPGIIVEANYQVKENGVLNVYIKDEEGYTHLTKKTIIVSTEPTVNNPPKIELTQNKDNPRQIDVTVTDMENYIDTIKWAEGSHDTNYFNNNGTAIGQGQLGKIITTKFTIDSIGTYTVFAEDQEGESSVEEINILSLDEVEEPDTTKPKINGVTNNAIYNDTVNPTATDEHLASVVLTKDGEVVEDYQNGSYIEGEGVFTLTARDETGNETIVTFTIDYTVPEIEILQENTDNKNVAVTINLTDNLTGIDILKIASGEQNEDYFENGGQQISITKEGISATGRINIGENGTYTVYTRDLAKNEKVQTFVVTTIDDTEEPDPEPQPEPDKVPPTIDFEKEVSQDKKFVNLTINVVDTESQIKVVKMENGEKDITYFENNGEELKIEQGNKTSTSLVKITSNGTYTVYAEDEAGNKVIETITITEIENKEPEPEPDTLPPTITGVEDGKTYKNYVTPKVTDENLAEVTLTRNGSIVENYKNGDQIKENGNYILTAVDEAGNKTEVSFTIKIENEDTNSTNNTNTNSNTNTNNNESSNTNTSNNASSNTNTNNSNNSNSTNTNTEGNNNTNVNNTNTNESTNNSNNQDGTNKPNGNSNKGTISNRSKGGTQSLQSSTTANSKLPYAGLRNVLIFVIIALIIVAGFSYIKYRKYRKF